MRDTKNGDDEKKDALPVTGPSGMAIGGAGLLLLGLGILARILTGRRSVEV